MAPEAESKFANFYLTQTSVSYEYDRFDRLVKIVYNDTGKVVNNYYSADGTLAKVTYGNGTASDMNYLFEYDSSGRIVRSTQFDNNQLYQRTEHLYDEFDRLYIQRWTIDGKTRSEKYTYDDGASGDGSMTQFKTGTGQKINYTYDALRRLSNASVVNSSGQELFKTAYAYKTVSGNQTSTQVQYRNIRTTEGDLITGYKYEYDALGNITEIRQSEGSRYLLYKYVYDTQNQLVKEVHYDGTGDGDSAIKTTYTYTYDTAGNIRYEKKTVATENGTAVAYEKEYSYTDGQWADLLTSVKNKTTNTTNSITYDESGNPLSYYNGIKTYANLTWEHGRQLKSITTGGKTYNYTYDMNGIRTQKVVDGVTHTYYTLNGKVMRESFPYNGSTIIMDFCYDELGRPFSVAYSKNGGSSFTTYFYATNAQGDVEGLFRVLLDETTGEYKQSWYGRYIYDAWGNVTVTNSTGGTASATSLIVRNPLRYRGYYYDTETGFYYLQSRYYDPQNHRFINADGCETLAIFGTQIGYCNLFVYCKNNPVKNIDSTGFIAVSLIFTAIEILADGAINALCVAVAGGSKEDVLIAFLDGAGQSLLSNLLENLPWEKVRKAGKAFIDIGTTTYTVVKCLKKGVDFEMALLAGVVAYALSKVGIDVGDEVANKFFEYVFGTSASLISEAITTAIEESGEYTTVSVWLGERVNSVAYRENQNGLIIHSSNHNNAVYNCIY